MSYNTLYTGRAAGWRVHVCHTVTVARVTLPSVLTEHDLCEAIYVLYIVPSCLYGHDMAKQPVFVVGQQGTLESPPYIVK